MTFVNPYNFVRVNPVKPDSRAVGQDRFQGHTGTITCALRVITPTIVVGARESDGLHQCTNREGKPIIPGTALRGMVRSIFEIISRSCKGTEPRKECAGSGDVCRACKVFGVVGGDAHRTSLVRFTDAKGESEALVHGNHRLPREGSPNPKHRQFYHLNPQRARKLYYHHQPDIDAGRMESHNADAGGGKRGEHVLGQRTSASLRGPWVRSWLREDSVLTFRVHFSGLDEQDLSCLLYALVLETGMGHKLGHGRPLGFGSCCIEIEDNGIRLRGDPGEQEGIRGSFLVFGTREAVWDPKQIAERIGRARSHIVTDPAIKNTLDDLRVLLRLHWGHPEHYRDIAYPDYDYWFCFDRLCWNHNKIRLPTTQEVEQDRDSMLRKSPVGRVLNLDSGSELKRERVMRLAGDKLAIRLPGGPIHFSLDQARQAEGGANVEDLQTLMARYRMEVKITGVEPLRGEIIRVVRKSW